MAKINESTRAVDTTGATAVFPTQPAGGAQCTSAPAHEAQPRTMASQAPASQTRGPDIYDPNKPQCSTSVPGACCSARLANPTAVAPTKRGVAGVSINQAPPAVASSQFAAGRLAGPHAEAGFTPRGTFYAAAAARKGYDAQAGVDVEELSGSIELGPKQIEAQAVVARVTLSSLDKNLSVSAEVLSARAALGTQNPDGSVGLNGELGATVLGVEGTMISGHNSVTFGLGLGVGAAAHAGTRDVDGDGKLESCGRLSAGIGTIAVCTE